MDLVVLSLLLLGIITLALASHLLKPSETNEVPSRAPSLHAQFCTLI